MREALICLRKMQDLWGNYDEYCRDCWQFSSKLPASYMTRLECVEENCVTEAEFDKIERKRRLRAEV